MAKTPIPDTDIARFRCESCGLEQFSPDWIAPPELYEALQKFPWYYLESKDEFVQAGRLVKVGDSVLEVGCGAGNFYRHLPAGTKYLGLEFNRMAIERARKSGLDVKSSALGDVARSAESKFDVVCAFQVLEHISDPRQFLLDMTRATKNGGLVIFSLPSEDSFLKFQVNNITNFPPHHMTRWPDKTFDRLAEILGTELIEVIHESLSGGHCRGYAETLVWRVVSAITTLGRDGIVPAASLTIVRRFISLVSLPVSFAIALIRTKIRGHTVTVILRKP